MMLDVLSWGSKVGIIDTGRVLDRDGNTVVASSAVAEVVVLEVEGRLGEAVLVGDIVDGVHNVEGVGAGSIDVGLRGRSGAGVLGEDELSGTRLRSNARLAALESDGVVATDASWLSASHYTESNWFTHAVVVVVVIPSLCQP